MRVKRVGDFVAELLFPPRCPWCDAVLGFVPRCEACAQAVSAVARPAGMPVDKGGYSLPFVEQAYAPYRYASPVQDAILRMKFAQRPDLARLLAAEMARFLRAAPLPPIDCVVPVPSGKRELHGRGYDVPYLLAKALGQRLGWPVCAKNLYKQFDTQRQMEQTGQRRRVNLLGAFAVRDPQAFAGKRVLLVDDVLTTGSTLNECAKMLLGAGACACYTVSVACVEQGAREVRGNEGEEEW